MEHRILSLMSLTNVHPSLSCTYETSKERANFLNLNVSLKNGAISTDLYAKSTNGHKYLHYKSSHPEHIKNAIPYSLAVRLSRIY